MTTTTYQNLITTTLEDKGTLPHDELKKIVRTKVSKETDAFNETTFRTAQQNLVSQGLILETRDPMLINQHQYSVVAEV